MSFRYDNEYSPPYYEDDEIHFSHEEYKDMKDFIKNPERILTDCIPDYFPGL